MSHPGRIIRRAFIVAAYGGGTLAAIFVGIIFIKSLVHAKPVRAASAAIYPSFCLGGWDHPQHASGASHADSPSQFTASNSAYLASQVSSQLFCGYFDIADKVNPPSSVRISFNWDMRSVGGVPEAPATSVTPVTSVAPTASTTSAQGATPQGIPATTSSFPQNNVITPPAQSAQSSFQSSSSESYTATASSSSIISPATGLVPISGSGSIIPTPSATPAAGPTTPAATPAASASAGAASTEAASTASTPTVVPAATVTTPAVESTPASATTPAAAPAAAAPVSVPAAAPAAEPAASSPSSFLDNVLYALVPVAQASSIDTTRSAQPFLNLSYSLDGVRWVSIGTVGADNWKKYTVSVPVSSWDDVRHLQIMVNVMPTIDAKPDIYLESIVAHAEYSRTTGEALTDTVSAASGAVSGLADAVIGSNDAASAQSDDPSFDNSSSTDEAASSTDALTAVTLKSLPLPAIAPMFTAPAPVPVAYVAKRKLSFNMNGAPISAGARADIKAAPSADGSSLTISGSCTKKYFVVLVYKNAADYEKKQSSFVANEARDCIGGSFTYDVSALPPELKSGPYFLMTADEDDTGPWTPSSKIFPVTIQATTTMIEVQSQ